MPPAPIPCTERPRCRPVRLPETAAMKDPMVKKVRPVSSMAFRPNMSEKAENSGRHTVAARKKEMPSQNDWMVLPWSAVAMVCSPISVYDLQKSSIPLMGPYRKGN